MPKGTNANSLKNLKPNESTQFKSGRDAVENGRKGGLKAQANRRARQREREEWAELLSLAMNDGTEEEIESLKDAKTKNLSISKAMKIKLITEALKGNIKAYECIMRYAGAEEKEEDEQEQNNSNETTTESSFIKALNTRAEELWKDETTDTEEDKKEQI